MTATTLAFDTILAVLEAHGCAPTGNGNKMARCPSHDDRTASLSVKRGDKGVVLKCFAGCETKDVVAALGLTMADLFDQPARTVRGKPEEVYPYTDKTGKLVYEVVRFPGKSFPVRRPLPGGAWEWGRGDVAKVLYRLPNVIEVAKAAGELFIVEGERDVHAAERAGAVATTSPEGAGNWLDHYANSLVGVGNVVVVADRDGPGRKHARTVAASLQSRDIPHRIVEAKVGKDLRDHLAAGHTLEELVLVEDDGSFLMEDPTDPGPTPPSDLVDDPTDNAEDAHARHRRAYVEGDEEAARVGRRELKVTRASEITVRPVHWLWSNRIALGTLALLGGREGIGKSTLAYSIAADVTRGTLPGQYEGTARAVIVAATEDSWEHTIVPRLMAAGADLTRVLRVDVVTSEGVETDLVLPTDLVALEGLVKVEDGALVLLDPLLSRLAAQLDTHKDAEVRQALEPLVRLADRTDTAVLGLIHVNKSASLDPLTLLMGSRAFAAVARSVLFAMADPDADVVKYLGQPKNNLGRTDLPTLTYRIVSAHVADTPDGVVWTGKVEWLGDSDRSIQDVLEASSEGADLRTATADAAAWLRDYLISVGGCHASSIVKDEGKKVGHSERTLKRAATRLKVQVESNGFPRITYWRLG